MRSSEDVITTQQCELILKNLELHLKKKTKDIRYISAPCIGLYYNVGLIKSKTKTIKLINPTILDLSKPFMSLREYSVMEQDYFNCLRYGRVVLESGFSRERLVLRGGFAVAALNIVDDIAGIDIKRRTVVLGLAREGGTIKESDYCVCASRKRFENCCAIQMKKLDTKVDHER